MKLRSTVVVALATIACAATAVPQKFEPTLVWAKVPVVSVTQFKDVESTDHYYDALQSLVERWGIVRAFEGNRFYPLTECTSGELVVLLNDALNQMAIVASVVEDGGEARFDKNVLKKIRVRSGQKLTSAEGLKALPKGSPYIPFVQDTLSKVGGYIGADPKNFSPYTPVTRKEFGEFAYRYFGMTEISKSVAKLTMKEQREVVSRADMVVMVEAGLELWESAIAP